MACPSGEGLLDDVLGVTDAAEHPVGDVEQVAVVLVPRLAERGAGRALVVWSATVHVAVLQAEGSRGRRLPNRTRQPRRM